MHKEQVKKYQAKLESLSGQRLLVPFLWQILQALFFLSCCDPSEWTSVVDGCWKLDGLDNDCLKMAAEG